MYYLPVYPKVLYLPIFLHVFSKLYSRPVSIDMTTLRHSYNLCQIIFTFETPISPDFFSSILLNCLTFVSFKLTDFSLFPDNFIPTYCICSLECSRNSVYPYVDKKLVYNLFQLVPFTLLLSTADDLIQSFYILMDEDAYFVPLITSIQFSVYNF